MNKSAPLLNRTMMSRGAIQGILLAILGIAFAIRLYEVSSVPLNVDEVWTVERYAVLPVKDIFRNNYSNNHPLASLLVYLFSPQTDHLFMMRWPFILIGLLSLPFVYRLAASLFGRETGTLALLLVGLSPTHIGYSVIIRGYSGLITLSVLSLYLLWRGLRRNRWWDWLGFAGTNILIIYFHLFGLLAAGAQLALAGGWLCWYLYKDRNGLTLPAFDNPYKVDRTGWRSRLIRLSLIAAILAIVYPLLIYSRANAILLDEDWAGDFSVWQNKTFSFSEDLTPLAKFAILLGPFSPGDVGLYLYFFLAGIGLLRLWLLYRPLALMIIGWFCLPFVVVFSGSQLLGSAFYVYFRFLLYLLPPFLILVALGIVTGIAGLERFSRLQSGAGVVIIRTFELAAMAGLLILLSLSTYWYLLTATHSDWLRLSKLLSARLQTQEITICEESQRGFAIPDRAKPHCMWMLDFFVSQLKGQTYSPKFQSTTDFIADYEHLQTQRQSMQKPGGVWLVVWQKIPFRPDQFVTDRRPPVLPPPSLASFAPYEAWHFGSATLVHIDSEKTLLGNLYQSVKLLAQIESKSADKARYYRSLAEIEAVQGHRSQAQVFFEKSWAMVEQAGGEYPELFLAKTRPVVARTPDFSPPSEKLVELNYPFGSSLCLQGYELSSPIVTERQALQLKLYWHTLDFIREDYTFFIRLEAPGREGQRQLEFQPFDGSYPTPWWWVDQRLVEAREFHLPPDLPPLDYLVQFGAYNGQPADISGSIPLFKMSPRPGTEERPGWQIEPLPPPEDHCLQPQ